VHKEFNEKDISLTFAKGLQVLSAFDAHDRDMTVPMIAKKTNINRTVARRLILTLQHLGYLECRNHTYRLTPHILSLASGFLQGRDFGKHVTPILRTFSEKLKEAISFAMLDIDQAIYVAHSPGDSAMITQGFTVGSCLPLQATAVGRTLIAFSTQEQKEYIFEHVIRIQYTKETLTDINSLKQEVETVVSQGYAIVRNEFEKGITSLAVPVLGSNNELIGALGIVGPNPKFEDEKLLEHKIQSLQHCARSIAIYAG